MKNTVLLFIFSAFLLLGSVVTASPPVILPEKDPETEEEHQLSWTVEPGVRYRLEATEDLKGDWVPVEGYPVEAVGPAMRERFSMDAASKFFRVVQIDEQAPKISKRDPTVNDYAVPRFGKIKIELADQSGVDASSIALQVGELGTFTTGDPQLDFSDDAIVFDNGGDIALGGYGEVIQVSLSVADTLGNSVTPQWSFTLEEQVVEADNVFTFGSPDAQRAGQQIRDIPTRVLAQRAAAESGPIRMAADADPWTIHSVEADRILIDYEGTAPTATFQTGTYLKNLSPASIEEIFYREVTSISDDAQAKQLTVFTSEVSLTDMVEEGTFSTNDDTVAFEVGEDGVIQRAIVLIDTESGFEKVGFDLDGLTFSMKDSSDVEIASIEAETLAWALESGAFDAKLDIGFGGLKRFRVVFSSDFTTEVILNLTANAAGSAAEAELLPEIPFGGAVVPVGGGVFVFIDGALGLSGRADIGVNMSARTGFRQTASGRFGIDNEEGVIFDLDVNAPNPVPSDPQVSGEMSLDVSIEPRLDISLYKVAGVEFVPMGLRVGPKFRVTADDVFTGDLEIATFGQVKPESMILDLFDYEPKLSRDYLSKRIRLFPESEPSAINFTQMPQDQILDEENVAHFMCSVNQSENVAYQWYYNDLPLSGATSAQLKLRGINPAFYGQYSVEATAGGSTVRSNRATLRVESDSCDYADTYPYPDENPEVVDDWNFYFRECTSYVAWKLNRIMKERFHNQLGGGRFSNAENWDDNATAIGLTVNRNPAVGAVAHWDAGEGMGPLGHVAYVEAVNPDGTVNISEYNASGLNNFGVRCAVEVPRYIHVQDSDYQEQTALEGFAYIRAGSFEMGDSFSEGNTDERPVHSVYLSGFYMGRTEVTYSQWQEVYNWAVANNYNFDNAGAGKGANHPVHTVSWYDVVKWCNAASEREGLAPVYRTGDGSVYRTGQIAPVIAYGNRGYRLPTEAEWEKAARGGLSGKRFPWGNTITHSEANYLSSRYYSYDVSSTRGHHPSYDDVSPYTSPVGSFAPNGYGLYDMAGNVLEWCNDWYGSSYYGSSPGTDPTGLTSGANRVVRGGSWGNRASGCRVAFRGGGLPDDRYYFVGFRLARSQ